MSAMQLDPARYRHHLNRFDMSDAEKLVFMQQLWAIMESFVSGDFHRMADAISLGTDRTKHDRIADDRLDSDDTIASTFNNAAGETAAGKTSP